MGTVDEKNLEESGLENQRQSNLWLGIISLLGVCTLALLCAGSGLVFWYVRTGSDGTNPISLLRQSGQQSANSQSPSPTSAGTTTPISSQADTILLPPTPTALVQNPDPSYVSCGVSRSFDSVPVAAPSLSPISFSTRQNNDGWPLDSALQFTTAITRVQASFGFDSMQNGMAWERVWFFGEDEILRGSSTWDAGSRGALTVHVEAGQGNFVPGRYRLEIYVEDKLLSQDSFLMVTEDTPTQRPIQVAYTIWDGSKHQINLLDLGNSHTQPLLDFAQKPTWSPDTSALLFYGEEGIADGTPGLWVLNVAQEKSYQVSTETFFQSLAWSPNRAYIASSAEQEQATRLVLWSLADSKAYFGPLGHDPGWSPEGRRLAYRGCNGGQWNISTIQVIGHIFDVPTSQQLTDGDDSQPVWSWDGQQIAFVRREGDNQDIYIITPQGTNLTRLTDHPAADISPAWTPDNRLVFYSARNGQWAIYIMDAEGANQRQLVEIPWQPSQPPGQLAVSPNHRLVEPTPAPPPKPRVHVPAGHGLLVVSNRQNNDEMTFTIDNVEHKIRPFQVTTLSLRPGHYTWTASWPARVSRTGLADIAEGQVAYPVIER
jgi:Tol biopolymer transport system component